MCEIKVPQMVNPPSYLSNGKQWFPNGLAGIIGSTPMGVIGFPPKVYQTLGQSFRMGGGYSSTRTKTKQRKRYSKSSFKKMVMNVEPAKHVTYQSSTTIGAGNIYTNMPTQAIVQGTSNTNRIGDEVYLCAIKLSGSAVTADVSGAYKYRILIGWTGEESTASNIATQYVYNGLSANQLYLPQTYDLVCNGIINSKAFTKLHDETIDISSQTPDTVDWTSFNITVPLNVSFRYQEAGSVFGKTRNLVVFVMGNMAGAVAGEVIGSMVVATDLIFK